MQRTPVWDAGYYLIDIFSYHNLDTRKHVSLKFEVKYWNLHSRNMHESIVCKLSAMLTQPVLTSRAICYYFFCDNRLSLFNVKIKWRSGIEPGKNEFSDTQMRSFWHLLHIQCIETISKAPFISSSVPKMHTFVCLTCRITWPLTGPFDHRLAIPCFGPQEVIYSINNDICLSGLATS